MKKQTFKDIQDAIDLAPLAHRVRIMRLTGYAFSTICKKLKVPKKYAKECCVGTYLIHHHHSLDIYKRSPQHRKKRLNRYHFAAYLNKKEKLTNAQAHRN